MESNLDWMGIAGMAFVISGAVIIAWMARAVILKRMLSRELAKSSLKHEQEYQRVLRESAGAQQAMAERLTHLESIEARLAEIERMLREVDEPVLSR